MTRNRNQKYYASTVWTKSSAHPAKYASSQQEQRPDDEPLTDGKTDIPDEPPAETIVPVPVPTYGSEETQFEDMALRTFLNTQYYKTANKDVIFYDAFGSDIRNFHHVLDNRIRTVNEGKDKISVMLK